MTEISPGEIFVFPGETFTFDVAFFNDAVSDPDHVGYGPEIEIGLPDGVTFESAISAIFGPLTPIELSDDRVVLRLPVGSYTPDQVADTLTITANAASNLRPDGSSLDEEITSTSRFIYGDSPTGTTPIEQLTPAAATVTPVLYIPFKDADTRFGEDETATGPNYPIIYTLGADVANGATIHEMSFTEILPGNLQFSGITGIELAEANNPNVQVYFTPLDGEQTLLEEGLHGSLTFPIDGPFTASENQPGGTLEVVVSQVVGTVDGLEGSDLDIAIDFEAFVPQFDASGASIISPTEGGSAPVINALTVSADSGTGDFSPIDLEGQDLTTDPIEITARDFAIQKHVELTSSPIEDVLSPGSLVEFRIESQISDYFSFEQIAIQDVLGDGYIHQAGTANLTFLSENGLISGNVPTPFQHIDEDPALNPAGGAYLPPLGVGGLYYTANARPGETEDTSPGYSTLVFDISGTS